MASMTATDAKNKFGQMLEMAQREPVHIQKNGRDVGVLVSPEEYAVFEASRTKPKVRPAVEALLKESIERHDSLYKALAK